MFVVFILLLIKNDNILSHPVIQTSTLLYEDMEHESHRIRK
jgi:hypothetical protein